MSNIARILDANANRAREALRVMEDAARFILDDAELTGAFKRLRHELAHAMAAVPNLTFNRDTPGDVGVDATTQTEGVRQSTLDVAVAAGKRLGEALRVIEEYGKLLGAPGTLAIAPAIEQLRYRGYELERRLLSRLVTSGGRQWRLCVLVTDSLCRGHDWFDVLRSAVDGGADCIELREKELDDRELVERARRAVEWCREHGVTLIVNDRPDIAMAAGADGVHLGQHDLSPTDVRRLFGRELIVGISTSRMAMAEQALRDGADYCGVGPMFPTTTKHKDFIAGPDYLRQYLAWDKLPHLAIGGVTPENIEQLVAVGVRGVAVSSAVCSADDPRRAANELRQALDIATVSS